MTKNELLAEIASLYKDIGTPILTPSISDTPNVKKYHIDVVATGFSEKNKKPVSYCKSIGFLVYNEGLPDEAAYYDQEEPSNEVNQDITGSGSLYDINRIYRSDSIRQRVRAAIFKAAQDILNENPGTKARKTWALNAIMSPDKYMLSMTLFVALNPTVQAAGGVVTDNVIQTIVNSYINILAE